jgi:hypothetical protein
VQKALEVFEGEWANFIGKPLTSMVADLPEDAETREGMLKDLAAKPANLVTKIWSQAS